MFGVGNVVLFGKYTICLQFLVFEMGILSLGCVDILRQTALGFFK